MCKALIKGVIYYCTLKRTQHFARLKEKNRVRTRNFVGYLYRDTIIHHFEALFKIDIFHIFMLLAQSHEFVTVETSLTGVVFDR